VKILVTAGPTREYLDDVRYLSNPATGKMGFQCAIEARKAGHHVTLVTGPVELPDPPGMTVVRVTTADEMHAAAMKAYRTCGAAIATAAVCDYRPARRAKGKIKKGPARMTLDLVRTPDILGEMGAKKGRRILVGFALESQDGQVHAIEKLRAKRLDAVVLNGPSSFGADAMDATVFHVDGSQETFRGVKKQVLARLLVDLIGGTS
jgi:phosphopantothenoylcysteine decarboxylase / phosphopantothenate---cysteine ligase